MLRSRVRAGTAGFAAAAAALLLAGCSLSGTIDVQSAERVAVDLTVSDLTEDACRSIGSALDGLSGEVVSGGGGDASICRVLGVADPSEVTWLGVSARDRYLTVWLKTDSFDGAEDELDIAVRMPGRIVTSTAGSVDGDSVRLRGTVGDVLSSGLSLVSTTDPAPPWPVVAILGILVGSAATLLGLRWRRRAASEASPAPGAAAEDGSVTAAPPLVPAPDAPSGAASQEPVDHTIWSRPPPEAADAVAGPRDPGSPAPSDHSVWAPPRDTTQPPPL